MTDLFSSAEILTFEGDPKFFWKDIVRAIENNGRKDILQSPVVLDVGGADGKFSKHLNTQGVRCVSLDRNKWNADPEANPVVGDAYKMPFADESFDIVYDRGAFDDSLYKHDFSKLLLEIARVLKSKGILAIYEMAVPPEGELTKYFRPLTEAGKNNPALWEKL
jgi:ubiquinone/menaquinone biosynthesis C-methylase UbiE